MKTSENFTPDGDEIVKLSPFRDITDPVNFIEGGDGEGEEELWDFQSKKDNFLPKNDTVSQPNVSPSTPNDTGSEQNVSPSTTNDTGSVATDTASNPNVSTSISVDTASNPNVSTSIAIDTASNNNLSNSIPVDTTLNHNVLTSTPVDTTINPNESLSVATDTNSDKSDTDSVELDQNVAMPALRKVIVNVNETSTVRIAKTDLVELQEKLPELDFKTQADATIYIFQRWKKIFTLDELEGDLKTVGARLTIANESIVKLKEAIEERDEKLSQITDNSDYQKDVAYKALQIQVESLTNDLQFAHEKLELLVKENEVKMAEFSKPSDKIFSQEDATDMLNELTLTLKGEHEIELQKSSDLENSAIGLGLEKAMELMYQDTLLLHKGRGLFKISEIRTKEDFMDNFRNLFLGWVEYYLKLQTV